MASDFDPYYKWLGIPPEEQPPNYYRLLGIPPFTADVDVIENAADQRMSHLRSAQIGQHAEASQRVLIELAHARTCLLNPQHKAQYDASLHNEHFLSVSPEPPPLQPRATPDEHESRGMNGAPPKLHVSRGAKARRKAGKSAAAELIKHIAGSAAGLLIGYLGLCWFAPRFDFLKIFSNGPAFQAKQNNNDLTPDKASSNQPNTHVASATSPSDSSRAATVGRSNETSPKSDTAPVQGKGSDQSDQYDPEQVAKLIEQRDVAVKASDIPAALKAAEGLAGLDGTDALEAKAGLIDEFRKSQRTADEYALLATSLAEVASKALQEERKDFAVDQASTALLLARKSGNQELVRDVTKLVLKIKQGE